ncbi:hypothetical protein AAHC03_025780 [Spirometra sp. Aus1]
MSVLPGVLEQAVECSLCLQTCRKPYRLPCEHFFCREPCLQALLNTGSAACPICRLRFTEADLQPFRFLNNLLELIKQPAQDNQHGEGLICPICVRQVETPLLVSAYFSEEVCKDCWKTGETLFEEAAGTSDEEEDSTEVSTEEEGEGEGRGQSGHGCYFSYFGDHEEGGSRIIYVTRVGQENSTYPDPPVEPVLRAVNRPRSSVAQTQALSPPRSSQTKIASANGKAKKRKGFLRRLFKHNSRK